MFKKLLIGVVVIGALLLGASAYNTTRTATAPTGGVTTAAKQWVVVKQFAGDGIKDTEQFTVGSQWRIDWDYTPPGSGGIIQIYVYDSGNSLAGVAANTQKAGADTSFQHRAGTYYLKVNATGSWKVAVQDNR